LKTYLVWPFYSLLLSAFIKHGVFNTRQSAPRCSDMANTILRLPAVKARTGRSRSSIYADAKAGLFPSPIRIGPRAVGWLESEVEAWLAQQIELSRKAVKETRVPGASRPESPGGDGSHPQTSRRRARLAEEASQKEI
jgi:prophage regulatory protein